MNTCSQQQQEQEQQLHESSVNRPYECKPVKTDGKIGENGANKQPTYF